MKELYQKRQSYQITHLMKYLRLVFNDHFTMILFFAFGGLLYFYSLGIKTISFNGPTKILLGIALGFIFTLILSLGQVATYGKNGDRYYLLPKEKEFKTYFKQAFWHSIWLPLFAILGVTLFFYPLLQMVFYYGILELILLLVTLITVKGSLLLNEIKNFYQKETVNKFLISGVVLLILSFMCFFPMLTFLGILTLGFLVVNYRQTFQKIPNLPLDWESFIEKENRRMKKIYSFIALFTDVPEIKAQVKRRKYFDVFLNKIAKKQKNTYLYLYLRRLVRGQEFRSLFLSLTSFTMILMGIFQSFYGNLVLGLVFLYLLGFQWLPLFQSFDYMTMTKLYPVAKQAKKRSFQQILLGTLGSAGILLIVENLFFFSIGEVALLLLAFLGEIFIFTLFYAPVRLKDLS